MFKKLITLSAVVLTAVSLSACSPAVEETPTPSPKPVEVKEELTVEAPKASDLIDFAENPEPVYDGVVLSCEPDGEGAEALSVRAVPSDASNPSAVEGDTSFFTVECSYPVSDEIMEAIQEMNQNQG